MTIKPIVPLFVQHLRGHEEEQDRFAEEITSTFKQHGYEVHQHQHQQEPSEADKIFEDLKQKESEGKSPPFHHNIITFIDHPDWRIDQYHYGWLGAQTYFVYRIFRPDGRIYDTLTTRGLASDELLGSMDHYVIEDKAADKVVPIKIKEGDPNAGRIHIHAPMSLKDESGILEEYKKRYNDYPWKWGDVTVSFVPERFPDCPCLRCNNEYGIKMENVYTNENDPEGEKLTQALLESIKARNKEDLSQDPNL